MVLDLTKQTVPVGTPPPPPLAVVLMLLPATGQIQIQWPPQLPIQSVQSLLQSSLATVENMLAAQNGGIIKATKI